MINTNFFSSLARIRDCFYPVLLAPPKSIFYLVFAICLLALLGGWSNLAIAHGSSNPVTASTIEMQGHSSYFQESCIELQAGTAFEINMKSQASVIFDIHTHQGLETTFLVKELVVSDFETRIDIATTGEYCLTWMTHESVGSNFQVTYKYSLLRP